MLVFPLLKVIQKKLRKNLKGNTMTIIPKIVVGKINFGNGIYSNYTTFT